MEKGLHPAGLRIAVTGPESTGKSTLCAGLAPEFGGTHVKEYARDFQMKHGVESSLEEIVHMAETQFALNTQHSRKPLFCDTEMANFMIWTDEAFGEVPASIQRLWDLQSFDLVLICAPDIPWESDALRLLPEAREHLFDRFCELYQSAARPFHIVSGKNNARWESAQRIIEENFCGRSI